MGERKENVGEESMRSPSNQTSRVWWREHLLPNAAVPDAARDLTKILLGEARIYAAYVAMASMAIYGYGVFL